MRYLWAIIIYVLGFLTGAKVLPEHHLYVVVIAIFFLIAVEAIHDM